MKAIFFILLVLSLFAFSFEKTKMQCAKDYAGCNFKCGLTTDKDDTYGLYVCTNKCEKEKEKCLKTATN